METLDAAWCDSASHHSAAVLEDLGRQLAGLLVMSVEARPEALALVVTALQCLSRCGSVSSVLLQGVAAAAGSPLEEELQPLRIVALLQRAKEQRAGGGSRGEGFRLKGLCVREALEVRA